MNSESPHKPHRTWFTTLLGVMALLVGGLASLFTLFALLLAIGKPYANTADPMGILVIFILPPGTLLAGFGLLFRQRWARWWMILLMLGIIFLGVRALLAVPADAGPATNALNRARMIWGGLSVLTGAVVVAGLCSKRVRLEFRVVGAVDPARGGKYDEWRVGHSGRDRMWYEERHAGGWRRIEIDGEMLTGQAHHVIYFADAERWRAYPDWACGRRDEIIQRVKSRFREPDYVYQEDGVVPSVAAIPSGPHPVPSKRDGTILPALVFLVVMGGASLWFAVRGWESGEVRLPARGAGNHRVLLDKSPLLFKTSIGVLGLVGLACVGGAFWLVSVRVHGIWRRNAKDH